MENIAKDLSTFVLVLAVLVLAYQFRESKKARRAS
jgi:hypothetical protein